MTAPLRLFSLLIFLSSPFFAQAQIENIDHWHEHEFHGCHHTKKKLKTQPLSAEQRNMVCGSNFRSDSIDVLNYAIDLDLTGFDQSVIVASCEITFTAKEDGIDFLPLDLLALTVDSVTHDGNLLDFDYDDLLLNVHLPQSVNIGETMEVTVHYHGTPTTDGSWGGFDFINGYAYNLGIGLTSNPYNFGRSWHPCFDNFVERATYDISIITTGNRTGYAIGEFLGEEDLGNGAIRRSYRMDLQLPTYLIGVAASTYAEVNDMYSGQYGDYPILLVGKPAAIADLDAAFVNLPSAIEAFEYWFGPYRWGQVGYVMTTQGAMEHASLIAYPDFIISGGQSFANDRLMAHELGHHWWGNITTMECPDNMWIKEGNAEYSAHLFTEFTFGKEAFLNQVKDNHHRVLRDVHQADQGFFALAGIPFEQTYSDHTYYKGASLMHNLRGYLGDDLFRSGMTSVLDTYEYDAIDAQTMEAHLTSATGVDMSHFFNGWMYQPGFANYIIDSVQTVLTPSLYDVTLYIQQRLRVAQMYHTQAPLEITFFDQDWNAYHEKIMVDGQYSEVTVQLPFEPVYQIINDRQFLNLGRLQTRFTANGPGTFDVEWVDFVSGDFEILEMPEGDSALVNLVHHWTGPDAPADVEISGTHYWTYGGIIPAGTKAEGRLAFSAGDDLDLDYELFQSSGEDDFILAWRPNAGSDWAEYPWYKKFVFGNNGFIRIDTMLPGDYAYARGPLPVATSVDEIVKVDFLLKTYPNPVAHTLTVQGLLPEAKNSELFLSDMTGRAILQKSVTNTGREFSENLNVAGLPPGMYWVEIRSEVGDFRKAEKFIKE